MLMLGMKITGCEDWAKYEKTQLLNNSEGAIY
jgi:hypothetical protein